MECLTCGKDNAPMARFCSNCGNQLLADDNVPTKLQLEVSDLFNKRRFATLIQLLADQTAPSLIEQYKQAQELFEANTQRMGELYREALGAEPPTPEQRDSLSMDFDDLVSIIDDEEVSAYAMALVDRAQNAFEQRGSREEAFSLVYASQVLMSQAPEYKHAVHNLLERLNASTSDEAPVSLEDQLQEALKDVHPTQRLDLAKDTGQLDVVSDPALEAIELLEQTINTNHNSERINDLLAEAHNQINDNSPYAPRLQRAEAQITALSSVSTFGSLLQQPLVDWLDERQNLVVKSKEILDQLEGAFASDHPIVEDLRARYEQKGRERARLLTLIGSLSTLEGQPLVEQLAVILQDLPEDYPGLAEAQQRQAIFLADQERDRIIADAQRIREEKREEFRQLRVDFDNMLRDRGAAPDLGELRKLRDRAKEASDDLSLHDDHPLDQKTFAYYDLLYNDLIYRTNLRSTRGQAAQTALGEGDYLRARQEFQQALEEARKGDDPIAIAVAERDYQAAHAALRQQRQQNLAATLADAAVRLEQFDFAATLKNLASERQAIVEARVEIDDALLERLEQFEQQAHTLKEQSQRVDNLLARARQLTIDAGEKNFSAAIESARQALGIAPWRDGEVQEQLQIYRDRQNGVVDGQLQIAEILRGAKDYDAAERLLNQLEAGDIRVEQRERIMQIRSSILYQKVNDQDLENLRQMARSLARQAAQPDVDIDDLEADIVGLRGRIGAPEDQKLASEDWSSLNSLLNTAETRLRLWKEYRRLLSEAERTAADDPDSLNAVIERMHKLNVDGLLPVSQHAAHLRKEARTGSRVDRVRRLLDDVRQSYEHNSNSLTIERIDSALAASKGLQEEDIVADRAFLSELLPLYEARELLTGFANERKFEDLLAAFENLSDDLKRDTVIQKQRRVAEETVTQQDFDERLKRLRREVQLQFNSAWDDPAGFAGAVAKIQAFADAIPTYQRQGVRSLDPDVLQALEDLASFLQAARVDEAGERIPEARRRVDSMINVLTFDPADTSMPLQSYNKELELLRRTLHDENTRLTELLVRGQELRGRFDGAVGVYLETISSHQTAFNRDELNRALKEFEILSHPQYSADRAPYIESLSAIITLVEQVDRVEALIYDGTSTDDEGASTSRAARTRKAIVTDQLRLIQEKSEAIRAPSGKARTWLGIQQDLKYKALLNNIYLADLHVEAQEWIAQAASTGLSTVALRELRNAAPRFDLLKLSEKARTELQGAGLQKLIDASDERFNHIRVRRTQISETLTQRTKKRNQLMAWTSSLVAVAALGFIGWNVPPVREQIVIAAVGTLTPLPTSTQLPTQADLAVGGPTIVVVTPTPEPTITSIPTATPVPPQSAIVILPGRVNVRSRPDPEFGRATVLASVEAGEDAVLTGFSDDPNGRRWYRVNINSRNLANVWIPAQAAIENGGDLKETLRILDRDGQLNQELRLPWPP